MVDQQKLGHALGPIHTILDHHHTYVGTDITQAVPSALQQETTGLETSYPA